jgi:hypothetical protein
MAFALLVTTLAAAPADAARLAVVDGFLKPRPMPPVAEPIGLVIPDACELYARVQTSQIAPGERGSLIHWMARCPSVPPVMMPGYFASSLASQGWTLTASEREWFTTYFKDDLELILEFSASGASPTSSVWIGERYWR